MLVLCCVSSLSICIEFDTPSRNFSLLFYVFYALHSPLVILDFPKTLICHFLLKSCKWGYTFLVFLQKNYNLAFLCHGIMEVWKEIYFWWIAIFSARFIMSCSKVSKKSITTFICIWAWQKEECKIASMSYIGLDICYRKCIITLGRVIYNFWSLDNNSRAKLAFSEYMNSSFLSL